MVSKSNVFVYKKHSYILYRPPSISPWTDLDPVTPKKLVGHKPKRNMFILSTKLEESVLFTVYFDFYCEWSIEFIEANERNAIDEKFANVHARIMKRNYEVVPQWWFAAILLIVFGLLTWNCEHNKCVSIPVLLSLSHILCMIIW